MAARSTVLVVARREERTTAQGARAVRAEAHLILVRLSAARLAEWPFWSSSLYSFGSVFAVILAAANAEDQAPNRTGSALKRRLVATRMEMSIYLERIHPPGKIRMDLPMPHTHPCHSDTLRPRLRHLVDRQDIPAQTLRIDPCNTWEVPRQPCSLQLQVAPMRNNPETLVIHHRLSYQLTRTMCRVKCRILRMRIPTILDRVQKTNLATLGRRASRSLIRHIQLTPLHSSPRAMHHLRSPHTGRITDQILRVAKWARAMLRLWGMWLEAIRRERQA